MNPPNTYNIPHNPQQQLQTALQHTTLSYFQTQDPIINAFITMFVLSVISSVVPQLASLPMWLLRTVKTVTLWLYKHMKQLIVKLFRRQDLITHTKTAYVEKITDERQLNPLYNAVAWYLMKQVDLNEELESKFLIDQKINETTKKLPDVFKRVVQNADREMTFKKRTVKYKLSANQISIDGEDKSRRNDRIILWTEVSREDDTILDQFIKVCMEKYVTYQKNRVSNKYIYQNMNGGWAQVCQQSERMADTIVLRNGDKEKLMTEVNHFIHNKDWYVNHGFLYSLGILFHGSPGTGKTSLIRYISTVTGRNTHYLRLSQIRDESTFNNLLKKVDLADTVLVMEDIDCAGKMVHSREKIYKDEGKKTKEEDESEDSEDDDKPVKVGKGKDGNITIVMGDKRDDNKDKLQNNEKVTLDVLLNILDGVLTTPGQIVIMTTNHKDVLDSALIRPGRVDVCLELRKCNHQMITDLVTKFYNIKALTPEQEKVVQSVPEYLHTPAFVMNSFRHYKNDINGALENILRTSEEEAEDFDLDSPTERIRRTMIEELEKKKQEEAAKPKEEAKPEPKQFPTNPTPVSFESNSFKPPNSDQIQVSLDGAPPITMSEMMAQASKEATMFSNLSMPSYSLPKQNTDQTKSDQSVPSSGGQLPSYSVPQTSKSDQGTQPQTVKAGSP